jgi:DNA-binding LytR/AlgR family response regulator
LLIIGYTAGALLPRGESDRHLSFRRRCFACNTGTPPQIVFLDIEMPGMNGFEMLEKLPVIDFEIIFTTSYDQYAIKAIRFSAWIIF